MIQRMMSNLQENPRYVNLLMHAMDTLNCSVYVTEFVSMSVQCEKYLLRYCIGMVDCLLLN